MREPHRVSNRASLGCPRPTEPERVRGRFAAGASSKCRTAPRSRRCVALGSNLPYANMGHGAGTLMRLVVMSCWGRVENPSGGPLGAGLSVRLTPHHGPPTTDVDTCGRVISPSELACVFALDPWTFWSAEVCRSGRASSHRENRFLSGGSGSVGAFSSRPLGLRRRAI